MRLPFWKLDLVAAKCLVCYPSGMCHTSTETMATNLPLTGDASEAADVVLVGVVEITNKLKLIANCLRHGGLVDVEHSCRKKRRRWWLRNETQERGTVVNVENRKPSPRLL